MDRAIEGSIYKTLNIENRTFEILYGYYSEYERERWGPTPIYPDFEKSPIYTSDGRPFVRADQDICSHYLPKATVSDEGWCNDCRHFKLYEEIIGICRCNKRINKIQQNE